MGFIDRLKTELESKEQQEFLRRQQREAQLKIEQERQQQLAAQAEALHSLRRQKATVFFQESRVENMLERLASVIRGSVNGITADDDQYYKIDPDSKAVRIHWEAKKIREDEEHGGVCEWLTWDILKAKSFIVEGDYRGTLHFSGGLFSESRIAEGEWRNKIKILDSALEKAYSHPRTFRYTGNYRSEYLDGGD